MKKRFGSNYRQISGGVLKQKKNKFLFVTLILLILNISFLSIFKQEKTILQEQTKDSYLAIYLEEEQINYIPKKDSGYVLDLEKSNCSHGVTLDFDSENWFIKTNFTNYSNTDNTRVKCSLYFKQKDVTVNFQMPNLLPEYNNSKWVFTSGLGVSVNANNYYDTTSIQFNTHSSFQSNALYLILLDETGTNIIENIASFGSNTQTRDKIYEFTHETGQYTLETRLNGSKQDIKYLDSFSFTKGKKYKLQADVSVSEDRLTWNIENFALYENVESQTIKPGTTVSKPEVSVTKKGYTLSDDWYTNKERTEKFDFQTPITQDTTLYAAWTANTYTITYNANGGSGAPASQSYTYDANGTINLSSTKPTRTGYTFLGWSLSPTATSPSYTAGQAWKRSNASNYTLYAVWKTVPASTITNMSLSKQSCTNSGGNERAWSCDISGNRIYIGLTQCAYGGGKGTAYGASVDLTNYTKATFNISADSVSGNDSKIGFVGGPQATYSSGNHTITLDVTNYKGSYRIYLYFHGYVNTPTRTDRSVSVTINSLTLS